jgi:hypothetical protein
MCSEALNFGSLPSVSFVDVSLLRIVDSAPSRDFCGEPITVCRVVTVAVSTRKAESDSLINFISTLIAHIVFDDLEG